MGRPPRRPSPGIAGARTDSQECACDEHPATPYWGPDFDALAAFDPDIADVVLDELNRLRSGLQLIASENFTSPAVLAALGSTLSNKYAEGYPGQRYYGGCEVVDRAEEIGIARGQGALRRRARQPAAALRRNANLAAYGAFLKPGDTFLAMALPHGGHLTHGAKVSFSGKWFNPVQYGVHPETEHIDYDQVRDLAREHRPKMIICGGSAIPRLIDFAAFREICDEVGAILMVDAAHFIGLVAGKAIPSPVPYADVVTFTTHKVLRGPRGGAFVCKAEHAKALDKAAFPMMQGGPLMHAVAAKAVNLKECLQPEYQAYARQVIANAQALTEGLAAEGLRPVAGGTDTHLALLDLQETGRDRYGRREALRRRRHRAQQERDPVRPAAGLDRLGHPGRQPGGDHPGHGRVGHEVDRLAHRDGDPGRRRQPHGRGRGRRPRARRRPPCLPRAPAQPPDPVREYAVVLLTAALVTFLATPVVRMAAIRLPDDGGPAGSGRARDPDPAGRRRGHVPGGGRGDPGGHPAAGAAPHVRRLADLRRARRRRADLPARRRSTTGGVSTRSPSSPARSRRPASWCSSASSCCTCSCRSPTSAR